MGAGASRNEAVCSRVRRQTKVKTDAHGHLRTGRGIDTERRVGPGKTVFDRLVGADPHSSAVFDYYVSFDEENTTVAGKARWGDLPAASPLTRTMDGTYSTKGGKRRKKSSSAIERVKEAIDELSDEIMRDENLSRHAFHQVGAYDQGPFGRSFDRAIGVPVRSARDRHPPSWTAGSTPRREKNLWIVPADVHF